MMQIELSPDYCCGGGHCGPLPGYYFDCPHCELESSCRTGYELQVGGKLTCFTCKGTITATERISEFVFTFDLGEALVAQ